MNTYKKKNKNKRIRLSSSVTTSDDIFSNEELSSSVSPSLESITQEVLVKPKIIKKKPVTLKPKVNKNKTSVKPKQESNPWDDLFSSIEEQPISFSNKVESTSESEYSEHEPLFEIDYDSFLKETPQSQSSKKPIQPTKSHNNTYLNERSYLVHDNTTLKQEISQEISSTHDFNEELLVNVHDIRTTSEQSTLDYILGSIHSSMISSLLELLSFVNSQQLSSVDLRKIVDVVKKVKLNDGNLKIVALICYKICMEYGLFKEIQSLLRDVLVGLGLIIDLTKFSKVNQELARSYVEPVFDIKFIEKIQENGLVDWSILVAIFQLLNTSQPNNLDLLEIFEIYFQDANEITSEIIEISPLLTQTFHRIDKGTPNEFDNKVIKIFILLTTNYDKHQIHNLYNSQWTLTMFKFLDQSYTTNTSLSLCLLLLGLLMNLTEWNLVVDIETSILHTNMTNLQNLQKENQITSHIIGYNAIILSYLTITHTLVIDKSILKNWLINFNPPSKLITNKIKLLLHKLNA